ncbi:RteC domain-containing protein [Dokdonia donghaensis]|uniref:RteC domain-containing protein n=1 Tax=Dokdonia donghaensis TaxID=326320 RepID=UPI00068E8D79|nr:RteC protein [Dokdonia donghaensis DSW-1]
MIYYSSVLDFENQFPRTGIKFQKNYIQESLRLANRFFFKNKDFIEYIKAEETILDELYFTRDSFCNSKEICCENYYRDDSFNTYKDLVLAQYTSYNRLISYIHKRHHQLKSMYKGIPTPREFTSPLNWTCSKTDLTELIYALHSRSAINNGNIEIKEIAKTFEKILHFKLDDFYKTYSEIKNRKKSQTKFLDFRLYY